MVMTNAGLNEIRDWLGSIVGATAPSHINVGDSDTSPTRDDTALTNELLVKAINLTDATLDKEVSFTMNIRPSELIGDNLREVGITNATTGGDLFTHSTHAVIAKTSNIEVIYQLKIKMVN